MILKRFVRREPKWYLHRIQFVLLLCLKYAGFKLFMTVHRAANSQNQRICGRWDHIEHAYEYAHEQSFLRM